MISVHYSATARQVFIDEGSRTTAVYLPTDIDPIEVAYVLKTDTLRAVIAALTDNGTDMPR